MKQTMGNMEACIFVGKKEVQMKKQRAAENTQEGKT